LVPLNADDFDKRLRLARLCSEAGHWDKAERYARAALEIDVTSSEAAKLLLKALEKQKKDDLLSKWTALLQAPAAAPPQQAEPKKGREP